MLIFSNVLMCDKIYLNIFIWPVAVHAMEITQLRSLTMQVACSAMVLKKRASPQPQMIVLRIVVQIHLAIPGNFRRKTGAGLDMRLWESVISPKKVWHGRVDNARYLQVLRCSKTLQ